MAGIFFDELRQLDFFPGAQDEKRVQNCGSPIPSSASLISNSDHLDQGIYQEEESIDLSALLQAYNSGPSSSTSSPSATTSTNNNNNNTPVSVQSSPSAYQDNSTNSNYQVYQNFLGPEHMSNCLPSMYGSESFNSQMLNGNVEMTPSPTSLSVDCRGVPTNSSPHVVQIDPVVPNGNFPVMRPPPVKAQRSGKLSKKMLLDKRSHEYKLKRAKNNDAVRKSREKSKVRVNDTEKRVKELEDENNQLQSKIALLTKELHVLKSLFTSAGVSQPPSFQIEEEGGLCRN